MLSLREIRSRYIDFFVNEQHKFVPSESLLPLNDPTTLFTGSGMQPMIPYLLGREHPLGSRLVNSQRCFRSQDIEEVGDTSHTTYFEMLGNWSLGDYFKAEQLRWIFNFLVHELGLPPERLKVSVFAGNQDFPRDSEAISLWQEMFNSVGINAKYIDGSISKDLEGSQIFGYDERQNWWSRVGAPENMPPGEPGGPDSELFFDFGESFGLHRQYGTGTCGVTCPCGRFLEIGNNVFLSYLKQENGTFKHLSKKNIDFGGGLERIGAALNSNPDLFKLNYFEPCLTFLTNSLGSSYDSSLVIKRNLRIILDHFRASIMLIGEGVMPSNKDRGYVLRRLLRRCLVKGQAIGLKHSDYSELAQLLCGVEKANSEMYLDEDKIKDAIRDEFERFKKSLARGLREFDLLVDESVATGDRLFFIYETYGFPFEVSLEELKNREISVDQPQLSIDFEAARARHQELSGSGVTEKFKGGLADHSEESKAYHTATHLLLKGLQTILGPEIHQRGSNITPSRLRFDFNFNRALSEGEVRRVEGYVKEQISAGLEVHCLEMDIEEARASGVEGMFWDRYPDRVTVYNLINPCTKELISQEVCGGPHICNTGELQVRGEFHILKQKSLGVGLRRISATFVRK